VATTSQNSSRAAGRRTQTAEEAEHAGGVGGAGRLAEDLPADGHGGVGGQHQLAVHGPGLGQRHPADVVARRLAGPHRLVGVGGADLEREAERP
jgi:hypothetical protein